MIEIKFDDLHGVEIAELLRLHLDSMTLHSPPESIHALDLEGLRKPEITFWSVWVDQELAGCCALKELNKHHGEVKSMRTASQFLRQGVAAKMMSHILAEARSRSYRRKSLETGSMAAFTAARRLYEKFGFVYCDPFDDYLPDPNSVFMTLEL